MVRRLFQITIVALLLVSVVGCSLEAAERKASSSTTIGDALIGEYHYSSGKDRDDVSVMVTVDRGEGGFILNFHGGHPDGHGAAPDGEGTGRVGKDGVFRFTYEDSFRNRGTGTFYRSKGGYVLSITISDVVDSRCLPFYDNILLQRDRAKKSSL